MVETSHHIESGSTAREREALLALWAVPGVGAKVLADIQGRLGSLSDILDLSPREWIHRVEMPALVVERLASIERLSSVAEVVREQAEQGEMEIAFRGDSAYPPQLAALPNMPPLLFHRGTPSTPHRKFLAIVGSRRPGHGFRPVVERFASECVEAGLGIVSGAAMGVDQFAHWGALNAGGETWAFLGSALDELDPSQAQLLPHFLERGGTFFSELPPGVRASKESFPLRNRLISGASHAVMVMRAKSASGSLYTAGYAIEQDRPLFVWPVKKGEPASEGSFELIDRNVPICSSVGDVCRAIEYVPPPVEEKSAAEVLSAVSELSEAARRAYALVLPRPQKFEVIHTKSGMPSAVLTSALCELELADLVVQHPGKLYEKV